MKFIANCAELYALVEFASRFAMKPKADPVMSLVNLELVGDVLHIRTTNRAVYIDVTLFVMGEDDGNVLVDKALLSTILKTIGEVDVAFSGKKRLTIKCGNKKRTMATADGNNFSPYPKVLGDSVATLNGKMLLDILNMVEMARNRTDFSILSGYYISTTAGIIATTDGTRAACYFLDLDVELEMILSEGGKTVLGRMLRLLGDSDVNIRGTASSWVEIAAGNIRACVATIAGEYPTVIESWAKSLPLKISEGTTARTNKEVLMPSLQAATLYSRYAADAFLPSAVTLTLEQTIGISLHLHTPQGDLDDVLAINIAGKDAKVDLHPAYLLGAVNSLPEDEVFITVWGELEPVLVHSGNFISILMPIRRT